MKYRQHAQAELIKWILLAATVVLGVVGAGLVVFALSRVD